MKDALNNLKDKPHDEKKAVAGGIAITVVVILMIGWGFLFLRKIQSGAPASLESGVVPEDQFDLNLIRNTERDLMQMYDNSSEELNSLRENAAQNQLSDDGVGNSSNTQGIDANDIDQFGAPPASY